VLKFLPAYAAAGVDAPPSATAPGSVPVRLDAADDTYLFAQGPASGLGSVRFPDWRPASARFAHLPNVARFLGQVAAFGTLVSDHGPQGAQAKDLDFLLNLGQIFTQVVYANLVAEAAALAIDGAPDGTRAGTTADVTGLTSAHVDRIFAVFVRDVSEYAVALHGQASATPEQRAAALSLVTAPQIDAVGESSLLAEVIGYAERG
jgi:acyl-CoA dehydrogenase